MLFMWTIIKTYDKESSKQLVNKNMEMEICSKEFTCMVASHKRHLVNQQNDIWDVEPEQAWRWEKTHICWNLQNPGCKKTCVNSMLMVFIFIS